jgi:hypothetical protein
MNDQRQPEETLTERDWQAASAGRPKLTSARNPTTVTDRCGTYAGYQAHRKRDEDACPPCLAANTAYRRDYYHRVVVARREARRRERLAHVRATQRLIAAHRDQWRALVIDEMRQM